MIENVKNVLEPWVAMRSGLQAESCQVNRRKELEAYIERQRSDMLKNVSRHAPFYKQRFSKHLKWKLIPTMSHVDLRQYGASMVPVSQSQIERVVTLETSGTTGIPKRIYNTRVDLEASVAYFQMGMKSFTSIGEKVFIGLPANRESSIGKLLEEALRRNGNEVLTYGLIGDLEKTLKYIDVEKPEVLVGIPAQIVALAKLEAISGIKLSGVKKVLLSTDYVADSLVRFLESHWNCQVYKYYGMTETGFAGGIECECHEGYHLYESEVFVEIISPLTGEVLPKGRVGEVVITTLRREGMPLIRYRTGDLAYLLSEPCPCGCTLERLSPIWSRADSVITLKNNQLLVKGMLDESLWSLENLLDFNVTFMRGMTKDELHLQVMAWDRSLTAEVVKDRSMTIDALADGVNKNLLGITVEVAIWDGSYCPPPHKRTIDIL